MEDWKDKLGKMVYSTGGQEPEDSDEFETNEEFAEEEQVIRIWLDRKQRRGKTATLIKGYRGSTNQMELLSKRLKKLCGVGGSAKDGEIILQGDQRKKVLDFLLKEGFNDVKLAGG
jgi:translation initiation factor 1